MDRVYGIIPASSGVVLFLALIVIVIGVILGFSLTSGELDLQSAAGIIMVIVFIGIIGFFVLIWYQSGRLSFIINEQGLRIRPGLWSRMIPREKIDVSGVKVINLNMETEYRPKWRLNGAGLPGFSAGWFRLYNKEKALLFITDRSSVVYIPTRENYAVLLSAREAYEMVGQMKHWG